MVYRHSLWDKWLCSARVYANSDPTYFNYPMHSIKDVIMGAGIGTLLLAGFYERLFMDLSEMLDLNEKTDLSEKTWASG